MAFERNYIDVGDIRTAYVEAGQGPVVLLIQGGDYLSLAHSSDWDLNLAGLAARGFRVIALDKYGQGYTGIPQYRASRLAVAHRPNSVETRRVMNSCAWQEVFLPSADAVRDRIHARIRVGELQVDTLTIWGRDDPSGPVEIAPRVLDLIAETNKKRTELHIFNQAGHYTYREHPERFNEVLAGFAVA